MKKGTTSTKAPRTSKTEKRTASKKTPRGKNGGTREGSGRKRYEEREVRRTLTEIAEQHANEVVEIQIIDKTTGSVSKVKKTRAEALLDMLYNEGVNRKNIPATKEYFDRTRGKAPQEVKHSGEIKTDEQRTPTEAELAAARAYEQHA